MATVPVVYSHEAATIVLGAGSRRLSPGLAVAVKGFPVSLPGPPRAISRIISTSNRGRGWNTPPVARRDAVTREGILSVGGRPDISVRVAPPPPSCT